MHRTWRIGWSVLAVVLLACTGCGIAVDATNGSSAATHSPGPVQLEPVIIRPSVSPAPAPRTPVSPSTGAGNSARPLAGQVVGIDPGHDGGNFNDPAYIDQPIWNGTQTEDCDTTGTETDGGYTEAQFNFNVAGYLRKDLIADGAKVVMTRQSNTGVGPCVTTRAEIINRARADVAIDIHADGGPPSGRGFTVLEPVADGPNDKVIRSSMQFGADVRAAMLAYTSMPESTYDGQDGITFRDDLAGLNLTTVPKILIECGNMRNTTDAALLTQPGFQRKLASAFTAAIVKFLTGK
jgi:N-acetylmuramoyl-L-alanine amidase